MTNEIQPFACVIPRSGDVGIRALQRGASLRGPAFLMEEITIAHNNTVTIIGMRIAN